MGKERIQDTTVEQLKADLVDAISAAKEIEGDEPTRWGKDIDAVDTALKTDDMETLKRYAKGATCPGFPYKSFVENYVQAVEGLERQAAPKRQLPSDEDLLRVRQTTARLILGGFAATHVTGRRPIEIPNDPIDNLKR